MRNHQILWLFLIPFCLINLCSNIFMVNARCISHHQSLLLHFKNSLTFNPERSRKLVHWDQSEDCCLWNGVTCENGHVIALDLSEELISDGRFGNSSTLFSLQSLQRLNLAFNHFHSLIPSGLQELKNLRYLNFSNAGFEGQVPIDIARLTRLVTLDLSSTFPSHHQALKLEEPNISMLLQNLTELKELYLDGITILAKGNDWIHALSPLRNLRVLSMSSCNLSGPIDSSLAKLQSLNVIKLNQNNLSSQVPESFANFSNLTTLQLSSCGLSEVFPKDIFQIQTLQVLDLSSNENLHGSLPNFPHLVSIKTLNFSYTNFSGKIPDSVFNLRQLSTLDLSNCRFGGVIPNSVSELSQLVHLDLSSNNFTGSLPSFNMAKNLKFLSLFRNGLRGEISSAQFGGLINLVSIDLRYNSLHGSVPSYLFTLPSLEDLELSYNHFDGQLENFLESSSVLRTIGLSGNNLEGPIPFSFFHLRRLSILQLSSNKFNGTVQLNMIKGLKSLVTLDLSHNNLSVQASLEDDLSSYPKMANLMLASCKLKEIPMFLRNQSTLLWLDLANNEIQGTLPNWIWRLDIMIHLNLSNNFLTNLEGPFYNLSSNLFVLDLHSNQLQGFPFFPRYAPYIDYSNNRFSSIIPFDIGNHLPFAFSLSLSNNSLHGKIDESFCNASNLRVLDLSHNSFIGLIPKCLITMSSNIRVLSLGGNKLSGSISDTMPPSCALRFLDLNGNLLKGTIPRSLANCKKLQVLNIGNNMLFDRFPCFLKGISTLRVLILRSNKFYGPINGCPNNIGDWKMLQIVDVASNNFMGKLPGEILRTWKHMMLDGDEAGSEFGHLFFDIYDNFDPLHFEDSLAVINKDLGLKLARLITIEPPYVIDHMFPDVHSPDLTRYQDSVTVINKGLQMKYVKILTVFTSLDFSSNHFEGPIPEELTSFKALLVLNLSYNAFSGHIPSSMGNLKRLESLDLSSNCLRGGIPTDLASLSFLAFLNLSYNDLEGRIPTGTQIQSFEAASFAGNKGLCGPPLTQNCNGDGKFSPPTSETPHSDGGISIDWNFLSAELGFAFGFGLVIMPLMFWSQWRMWYWKFVDDLLFHIFPQLDFVYESRAGKSFRTLKWKPY